MADDRMLNEAIEAIRSGEHRRAKDLITRLLRTNQRNTSYWLYMSTTVETNKERIFCLQKALAIDPDNPIAKRGLIMLGELPPDDSIRPITPKRGREWDIGEFHDKIYASVSSAKTKKPFPIAHLIGLLLIGVVGISVIVLGFSGQLFGGRVANYAGFLGGGTIQPLITAGPSPTTLPTSTPEGWEPTPTVYNTPSVFDVDFTPTPLYIHTPHPESEDYQRGMQAFIDGDYEEAIRLLTLYTQQDDLDVDVDARYYIGMSYFAMEEYREARDAFHFSLDIDDTFAPAYYGRAIAWLMVNPEQLVGEDFNQAIAYDPEFLEAYLARASYRLLRNNPEGALEDAERALELSPNHAIAYHLMAAAYIEIGQYEEVLDFAQRSFELDPSILENHLILGQALVETGNPAEALESLLFFLSHHEDDPIAWLYLGIAQQANGEGDAALESLTNALILREGLYQAYYYRGLVYYEQGDYEEAMSQFDVSARSFPDWFEPQLYWAVSQILLGETADGYFAIEGARSRAETDEQFAMLYYWRAISFEELGDYEYALRDWELLLELPHSAIPNNWLSVAEQRVAILRFGNTEIPSIIATETPTSTPTATETPTPEPTETPAP